MIEIENLKKSYGDIEVLKDINLTINEGEVFGIAGRSGAGKSTLLRCINRLENYDSGSIKIFNTEVESLSDKDIRLLRKDIGMIFQNFPLISRSTVFDNIALPMSIWECKKDHINNRVKNLLDLVNISDKCYSKARELSGGQKQRVSIARALAMNPKILLCDEATSALDPNSTDSIVSLLKDINDELKITIVVVTHEMDVIQKLCDDMAIVEDGVIKATGSVEDMFVDKDESLLRLLGKTDSNKSLDGEERIEIFYDSLSEDATLFSNMVKTIDVDFKLLRNEKLELKNKTLDTVMISISSKYITPIKEYLEERNIRYKHY